MNTEAAAGREDGDISFIEQMEGLPKGAQRLAVVMAVLKLPTEQRDDLIAKFAEMIRASAYSIAKEAAEFAADISVIADFMQERQHERGEASEAERRLQECCDEGLAFFVRNSHGFDRATRSESRELTCTTCGLMHESPTFLKALRRDLELSEDDDEKRETLRHFADNVHRQCEELADLISKYPKAAKGIGGNYPNWPFLMFRRDGLPVDYRRQAELIELGDTCAVNPSPRVNWNLLQRYLFSILEKWQKVYRFIGSSTRRADFDTPLHWLLMRDGRSPSELVKMCLAEYPSQPVNSVSDAEAEIFLKSFELPPLTRARETRRQWAECFFVPLIDLREADLEAVPAFAGWLGGDNMRVGDRKGMLVAIKEGIIRALETMARDTQG